MSAVIWVHADALSRQHPVFDEAPEGARVIYVWDADDLARRDWSLKRCVFVLECLAGMEVEILQGRSLDVLTTIESDHLMTAATSDPCRMQVINALGIKITVVQPDPFVTVPDGTDMGRFFRYWDKAKRSALQPLQNRSIEQGKAP